MKGYVCLIVFLLAGVSLAQTTQGSDEQEVLKVQQTWLLASQTKDNATLHKIIGDDFVGSGPGGVLVDKDMVANIPQGDTPFDHQKLKDVSVKVFGSSAVAFARLVSASGDDDSINIRIATFYAKRGGEWRMIAAQLVHPADEAPNAGK